MCVRHMNVADVGILTVHVYTNGTRHELSTKCPGLKPLVEQVRPLLYRKIAANILLQDPKIVFRLQVTNKEDRKWTSPSKNFWVSETAVVLC